MTSMANRKGGKPPWRASLGKSRDLEPVHDPQRFAGADAARGVETLMCHARLPLSRRLPPCLALARWIVNTFLNMAASGPASARTALSPCYSRPRCRESVPGRGQAVHAVYSERRAAPSVASKACSSRRSSAPSSSLASDSMRRQLRAPGMPWNRPRMWRAILRVLWPSARRAAT